MDISAISGSSMLSSMSAYSTVQNNEPPDLEEFASNMSEELISEFDADGSGSLSLEESLMDEEDFDVLDTNQDGVLSSAELAAELESCPPADGAGVLGAMMAQMGPPPGEGGEQSVSQMALTRGTQAYEDEMNSTLLEMMGSSSSGESSYSINAVA